MLIGLSLLGSLRSRSEQRADADRFASRAQRWQQDLEPAISKGSCRLSTSRHDTIRSSGQRVGLGRKRVWKRHCQSNFVSSEARRCIPELLSAVPIDQQEWDVRGQAQKG